MYVEVFFFVRTQTHLLGMGLVADIGADQCVFPGGHAGDHVVAAEVGGASQPGFFEVDIAADQGFAVGGIIDKAAECRCICPGGERTQKQKGE